MNPAGPGRKPVPSEFLEKWKYVDRSQVQPEYVSFRQTTGGPLREGAEGTLAPCVPAVAGAPPASGSCSEELQQLLR